MNIKVKNVGSITVVELEGRIDSNVSPELETGLLQLVQEGKKFMVLDFKGVEYMASAGLRVLLILAQKIKKLEGLASLANINDDVGKILSMTGFYSFFKAYNTVDQAIHEMGE